MHLDETGGNIINFKQNVENVQFEMEEYEDSGFFLQEKIDEDITVISIIDKETEKSKSDKSAILLKEEEFEVEAILDYEATVSFILLSLISFRYFRTSLI